MQRIFVALAILALSASARAGGIALESYTGDRPADASRLLSPILEELAKRGFSAGDTLARTYDTAVSRAAQSGTGLPGDFAAQADRGFRAWVAGKFAEATEILAPLVKAAHANTGAFARDQTLRDPLLKAMIALALSYQRSSDEGAARETFGEILRSFPDTQLARGTYGPEAAELFEQVRHTILANGRGKLTVKVTDENAAVFIDERLQAQGTTTVELVPGEYRVCMMLNKQPSRSHSVVVRAGADVTLTVDPRLDQVLRTIGWTGFAFGAQADRDTHEGAYAAQFANAIGANAVAVIGIDQIHGHPAIVGSLISLQNGRELRRASVATEPDPSTERLHALARFLAGDEPAAGLEVQMPGTGTTHESVPVADDHHADEPHDEVPHARWGGWKWVAGGAGVAALGTGVTLLVLDGRCHVTPMPGRPCNDFYSTATPGFIVLGAGAAIAGIAIYMFVSEHKETARTAYIVPTPGGAVAGFATSW